MARSSTLFSSQMASFASGRPNVLPVRKKNEKQNKLKKVRRPCRHLTLENNDDGHFLLIFPAAGQHGA
jgi:hypothetical protein